MDYEIRLDGGSSRGARIDGGRLALLLQVLSDGAQRSLRMRMEGRSSARGSVPGWLREAASFDFLGLREGSTILQLQAESLRHRSPGIFAQGDLFPGIDPDRSCLSVLMESLGDVFNGVSDSDRYDADLVDTFSRFEPLIESADDVIEFSGDGSLRVGRPELERLHRLRGQTPPPHQVRISGTIDLIRHSDRMFALVLESGQALRGVATNVAPARLAELFGRAAVISGRAVYRPSGANLRIEADSIEPAGEGWEFWSRPPLPLVAEPGTHSLRRPQGARSGLNAIFGKWPGEESDAELAEQLTRIS